MLALLDIIYNVMELSIKENFDTALAAGKLVLDKGGVLSYIYDIVVWEE
jgi:hypothetical protein